MRMNVQSMEMPYFCTYMHAFLSIELDVVYAQNPTRDGWIKKDYEPNTNQLELFL